MKVAEIMANIVRTVEPEEPLTRVAQRMRDYDIGCLPVCSFGRVVGILTDRDLVVRSLAETGSLEDVTAGEVMSAPPLCCRSDDTIKQAAGLMEKHRVRRLPVLDADGGLAGIVSLGDICNHASQALTAELIRDVSHRQTALLADIACIHQA